MTPKIRQLMTQSRVGFFLSVIVVTLISCNNALLIRQSTDIDALASPPTLSPSFLTAEAVYNARLKEEPPTPPLSPLPTPTPAFTVITSTEDGNLLIFRGSSAYQETPQFQITFSPQIWHLVDTTLHHQQLPGCTLELNPAVGEEMGPLDKSTAQLAGYAWEVRSFPAAGRISYFAT